MRTLAVMHLADIGGPAKTLYPRLAALAARGGLRTLVPATGTVAERYASIGTVTPLSYAALTVPASFREAVSAVRTVVRDIAVIRTQLRAERPDLVVVVTITLPAALVAARLERIPSIVYVAEILESPTFTRKRRARSLLGSPLLRLTLWCSTAIVCPSQAVARQFKNHPGSVVTIHPGIEAHVHADRKTARQRHDIPEDAFCISVVGSLSEGRGQDVAIRALLQVLESVPRAYLLVVGVPHPRQVDLDYQQQLVEMVDELGLQTRVGFTGFVEAIGEIYAATDVLVNPVRISESAGRTALEALAAGRPVIASRVGAIPELLGDEVHALLVEPGDPDRLARAVVRLCGDRELRDRLVAAGQELVATRFSEQVGVEEFALLAEAVTGDRARSGQAHTRPNGWS